MGYRWEEEGRDFLRLAGKLLRGLAWHRGGVECRGETGIPKGERASEGTIKAISMFFLAPALPRPAHY